MIAQLQLLNKILDTKDFSTITTNNLTDDFFFNCKDEFNFIKNHYEQYKTVPDVSTFKYVFPNFDIVEVSEPNSYLLEELYKDYNASFLASCFNNVKKYLELGETVKAQEWFNKAHEGQHTGAVITCTDLIEDTSRYDHYIERTTDQTKYYLTTGFSELDVLTGGIDRENENMIIMARPGVGKTNLLLKMAATAAQQGLTVGIFEGEMTKDKIGYRLDTFLGHISNTAMNRGYVDIKSTYKHFIDSLPHLGLGKINVMTLDDIPSGSCTVNSLRSFVEQQHLDVLFVDQYDLMDDDSKSARTAHEHIANIAKEIKKLQVEKKIPIISVCQMNRQKNEDGSQDTAQAAGSDMISRYATTMIALEQKQREDKRIDLTLNIVKARDGGDHNKLVYTTNFNTGTFEPIICAKSDEEAAEMKNSYKVDPADGDAPF